LTAPELAFLVRSAETVETVVLAMTKVDKFPSGWREVLAENRALLRRHAPRFADADIIAVSSQYAAEAQRLPDGEVRRTMAQVAGVERLAGVLAEKGADLDGLAIVNAIRIARSGLHQVAAQLSARRAAVTGGAAERAGLEAERARLGELRTRQQRWTLDLERDLGQLRRATVDDVVARLTETRDRWTLRAEKERRGLQPSVSREFMTQVCSELQAVADEVAATFERRLRLLVGETYGLAGDPEALLTTAPHELHGVRPRPKDPSDKSSGLLDPSLAATAFLGVGLAAKLPIAAVLGSFLGPVSWALGGAWLGVNVAFRAMRAGRLRLRTWVAEVTQALQMDLVAATDGCLREIKPEIVVGFRQFLADAVAAQDGAIRESDRAAAASAGQRVEALDRHLAAVAAQQDLLDAASRPAGTSGPATASKPATPRTGTPRTGTPRTGTPRTATSTEETR
jgi:hypothetical protein